MTGLEAVATGIGTALAEELFRFVTAKLPDLLSTSSTPEEALERLGKLWGEHRTHQIQDRSSQVASNRSEVDALLASREADAGKKSK